MELTDVQALRAAATATARILEANGGDPARDTEAMQRALAPLVGRHERLFEGALHRPSSLMARSRVIYFDPDMTFILSCGDTSVNTGLHNHGVWNILFICAGSMDFQSCRRHDDLSRDGYADLTVVQDNVVRPGELGVAGVPPHDIHAVRILEPETWILTVAPGHADQLRQFYDPETKSYSVRRLFGDAA